MIRALRQLGGHALLLCAMGFWSACAYQFQDKRNPLQKLGVSKLYVSSFKNKTYRPGIEQLFTTSMIREIQKSRSFQLVNTEAEADAVLNGRVLSADTSVSSTKAVDINTTTGQERSVSVGAQFTAGVSCEVNLVDRFGRTIFSHTESGSKVFPGSTGLGDAGATNALINDSEQRLAIQFLASQMMASMHQLMINVF